MVGVVLLFSPAVSLIVVVVEEVKAAALVLVVEYIVAATLVFVVEYVEASVLGVVLEGSSLDMISPLLLTEVFLICCWTRPVGLVTDCTFDEFVTSGRTVLFIITFFTRQICRLMPS